MTTAEQRTTPEMRATLRRQLTREIGLLGVPLYRRELTALLDDADALAGALAEVAVLRTALRLVLEEMEGCEGRQGMWEDGIDEDYRRAIEQGRAALASQSGAAEEGEEQ